MKVTPGVTRTPIVVGASPEAIRVDRFYYPPGGHTHWHLHTGEQILHGESGRGWVQFEGRPRVVVEPGEVVHVPISVRHWHGAVPDEALVHLAVTAGGGTEWLGEVTSAEYWDGAGTSAVAAGPSDPDVAVRAFISALENKDVEAALTFVTEDVVYDNVPIGSVTGRDAVRTVLSRAIGEAQAVKWVIRRQVGAGDVVMNERLDRFLVDGTWIEVPVAGLFVLRGGRIALWRDYFDLDTYRRQKSRS
jgi:limonene-1,2-epoxide hydrolase